MKVQLPARPKTYKIRLERIRGHFVNSGGIGSRITPLMMMELELLQQAYYGSQLKAGRHLLWAGIKDLIFSKACKLRIKVCDWMGWTKVYHYHETELMRAHSQRHGRKCSGSPNCQNDRCIDDSVPKWYKKITGWRDFPDI